MRRNDYEVVTTVRTLTVGLTLNGSISLPVMIGVLIVTLRMLDPISQLGELAGTVQINADAIGRVRALLAVPPLPEPAEPAGRASSCAACASATTTAPPSSTASTRRSPPAASPPSWARRGRARAPC
ncbi:hypothetical protein [Nonomuraea longispora]|uniref:hypothetical protein n=1 Tax=Nonomuraea longispora TaxID=1848320 RepID=UPI001C706D1A|nr:hypothetical protein [Nonomuraea longispora]